LDVHADGAPFAPPPFFSGAFTPAVSRKPRQKGHAHPNFNAGQFLIPLAGQSRSDLGAVASREW